MKNKKVFIAIVALFFVMSAFKITNEIIERLGMEQKYAQLVILNNFVGSFSTGPISSGYDSEDESFKIPYVKLLPSIVSGDKAGAAKELCDYVKSYVNSEEFIADYDKRREEALPLMVDGKTISTLRGNIIVYGKNIRNYKTDTKYVAEQQLLLDADQKSLDAMLEAAKKPFPDKELWEKAYPTDPAILVKKKLQEYLQLVATVDFTAKLITTGDRAKFVNPVYEKKNLKWKAIYRAGKEVNEVVTAFVKEWLKGAIIATEKVKISTNDTEKKASNTNSDTKSTTTTSSTTNSSSSTSGTTTDAKPAGTEVPAVKEKKNLFRKLKDKSKAVINF